MLRYDVLKLGKRDPYNIATRLVWLYTMSTLGRFQQQYFIKEKSTVSVIKVGRHISTTCKDSSQKKTELYDRNRKGSPLFTYAAIRHHSQCDKKWYKNEVRHILGRRHDFLSGF